MKNFISIVVKKHYRFSEYYSEEKWLKNWKRTNK